MLCSINESDDVPVIIQIDWVDFECVSMIGKALPHTVNLAVVPGASYRTSDAVLPTIKYSASYMATNGVPDAEHAYEWQYGVIFLF